MDETEILELERLLGKLKQEQEEGEEEGNEESFYLPKVPRNFYFNPDLFRKLVTPDLSRLAKLVIPNLRRLRK